jgi:peptidyl-tRNA hydrolase, PTH1 family
MKLIVGLGNPGEEYERTRHNLGFMIADRFLKNFEDVKNSIWEDSGKFKSDICQIEWQPKQGKLEKVILTKPKTYMNNSGMAVKLITDFYKINSADIWVIHDDIDLPLGSMKIRFGGASAGHHGIESIMNSLRTDKFWRFRLGIGIQNSKGMSVDVDGDGHERIKIKNRKLRGVDDYVLGNFVGGEKGKLKILIQKGTKAIEASLEHGLEKAMNSFNTK